MRNLEIVCYDSYQLSVISYQLSEVKIQQLKLPLLSFFPAVGWVEERNPTTGEQQQSKFCWVSLREAPLFMSRSETLRSTQPTLLLKVADYCC